MNTIKARSTGYGPLITLILIIAPALEAAEPVHWEVVQKIREEAFENSHVMENASWLTDVFGPRNAKSPSYIAAAEWARDQLRRRC